MYKNKMSRQLGVDDGVPSTHSPSSRDSQWAAANACDAVLRVVRGGGAGRPGLVERMGEVLFQRVLFIPNNHLRRGGGAFSPEERRNTSAQRRRTVCSTYSLSCMFNK